MTAGNSNSEEDLAIQYTLSMSIEQRLELIALLIAEKITEDISTRGLLLKSIKVPENAQSAFSF